MQKFGSVLHMVLAPLDSVTLTCTPSVMSFAASVDKIATVMSWDVGTASNANACAESCSRCRCLRQQVVSI